MAKKTTTKRVAKKTNKFDFGRISSSVKNFPSSLTKAAQSFKKFQWLNLMAALCYLNVLMIVPYIAKRRRNLVRFHLTQGVILMALSVLLFFLLYIPFVGWLAALIYAFYVIFGVLNALLGRERSLPLIGQLAGKL